MKTHILSFFKQISDISIDDNIFYDSIKQISFATIAAGTIATAAFFAPLIKTSPDNFFAPFIII